MRLKFLACFIRETRQHGVIELFRQLKNTPRVAGVMIKKAAVESFNDTIAKNLMTIQKRQFQVGGDLARVGACGRTSTIRVFLY